MKKTTYGIILPVLISVVSACTLQPGNGNGGGGNTSSAGGSSSSPGMLNDIYVATNGSDLNSGAKDSPFLSLQRAVDMAADGASINVAEGIYTNGNGLNYAEIESGVVILNKNNLHLLGGWNADFTIRSGYSELDGNKTLIHILFISNASGFLFDGFTVRNGWRLQGSPNGGWNWLGAGILTISSVNCQFTNITVSNNTSSGRGGGLCFFYCSNVIVNGAVSRNSAYFGGGMEIASCSNFNISGSFTSNSGGGILIDYTSFNKVSGIYSGNFANTLDINGGGIYIGHSSHNSITGVISGNSAYSGGGIYLEQGSFNNISASVINNTAFGAGGINMITGSNNTIGGTISNNMATNIGGLQIYDNSYASINCTVSGNSALNNFGGMHIAYSYHNTVDCIISGNTAGTNGGGLTINDSWLNTVSGTISSNSARYGGGICFKKVSYSSPVISNMITNAMLIHNRSDHGVICFDNSYNQQEKAFEYNMFIGCTIGGQGPGYGIYENGTDISNNIFINNIFLTNTLNFLYHDFADGDTGLDEISVLNTPDDPRHDAITAEGNTVSNE